MKTNFFIILIIALAVSSCKKDENTNNMVNQKPDVEKLILSFKDKLQNHLKDGGTYTTDSAVWYVEALLNYTYGNGSVPCKNYLTDSAEIAVNDPNSGVFTIEQLATVFDFLENEVVNNQPENTNIIAIDVYTYPENDNVIFASLTAYATPKTPELKSIADTSGYWFWGADKGMCGPDSGLYVGMDATDILEDLLNTVANDYWTNIETKVAWPWQYEDPNFPFDEPYLYPTRLYSAGGPTPVICDFCLSPDHIAYYASSQGIGYIIDDLCPSGKRFMYCDIWPGVSDDTEGVHVGYLTYGTPQ